LKLPFFPIVVRQLYLTVALLETSPPLRRTAPLARCNQAGIKFMIPEGVELFGENMTAVHSIEYTGLGSWFYLFAVRSDGEWWGWDRVEQLAATLGIPTTPVK
jgi:hypothetical protein